MSMGNESQRTLQLQIEEHARYLQNMADERQICGENLEMAKSHECAGANLRLHMGCGSYFGMRQ
ncbi:hypothetical protein AMTRI_Chr01g105320 [Amborella trichopoda]